MVHNICTGREGTLGLIDHERRMLIWFTIYRERRYLRFTDYKRRM